MAEYETVPNISKKKRKRPKYWTVSRAIVMFLFLLIIPMIGYWLFKYHSYFPTIREIVAAMWGAMLVFFGFIRLKRGRGMTLPTLLGLLIVKMTVIAYFILICALLVLSEFPVHPVVITTTLNHKQLNGVTIKWDNHDEGGTIEGEKQFCSLIGSHRLLCKYPGYRLQERDITVRIIGKTKETVNFSGDDSLCGNLHVTSQPSGAEIWIDTVNTGLKTPNDKYNLAVGEHMLELKKNRFHAMRYFMIEEGKTCTTTMILERPPDVTGSIEIDTAIAQVEIFIDGRRHSVTQVPATISGIPVGSRWIELRTPHAIEEGFALRWRKNVSVRENMVTRVKIDSPGELIEVD